MRLNPGRIAAKVEEAGGYKVQHYHEGTPLEETMHGARTRALAMRSTG